MQTEFTQFSNWLTCQYPHSSARKHYLSDLALFFLWAGKSRVLATWLIRPDLCG
jgi:hypothetical protein